MKLALEASKIDGFMDKGACCTILYPEFDPCNPHKNTCLTVNSHHPAIGKEQQECPGKSLVDYPGQFVNPGSVKGPASKHKVEN